MTNVAARRATPIPLPARVALHTRPRSSPDLAQHGGKGLLALAESARVR